MIRAMSPQVARVVRLVTSPQSSPEEDVDAAEAAVVLELTQSARKRMRGASGVKMDAPFGSPLPGV